jgi:hypothetical protein
MQVEDHTPTTSLKKSRVVRHSNLASRMSALGHKQTRAQQHHRKQKDRPAAVSPKSDRVLIGRLRKPQRSCASCGWSAILVQLATLGDASGRKQRSQPLRSPAVTGLLQLCRRVLTDADRHRPGRL